MLTKFINDVFTRKSFWFLLLLILVTWFACKNMDIVFMIFISLILACALSPLADKLSKKMSRGSATLIVVSAFVIICAICFIPIITLSFHQLIAFAESFPQYLNSLDDNISNVAWLKMFGITSVRTEEIMNSLSNSSSGILENAIAFTKEISSTPLYIFTSIILLYFFIVDKDLLKESLLKVFPSEIRKKTKKMLEHISSKLGGYAVAQTIVSGSVWVTMTIGLLLLHVEYPIVLGLISGVLSLIPVVGSALSLVICLIATYQAGVVTLVLITILFTISHFIENNVVRPYVYSKMLNLHPVIIFLALFIGGKYAGFMGMLLAPPFAMALFILFDELYIKKME